MTTTTTKNDNDAAANSPSISMGQLAMLHKAKQATNNKKKENETDQLKSGRIESIRWLAYVQIGCKCNPNWLLSSRIHWTNELSWMGQLCILTSTKLSRRPFFFFLVRSNPILSKKCDSWLTCNSTPEWDRISFNLPMLVTANWRFVFVGLISAEASRKHIV